MYRKPANFEEAKAMTIRKWESVVRGKQPDTPICGFCIYYASQQAEDYCKHLCPFADACDTVWDEWNNNKTVENAYKVLEAVKATEEKA